MKMNAPEIDLFLNYSQQNPLIKDPYCMEKLVEIFDLVCELEEQGDDELRIIWIQADRGSIDDYGIFEDFREEQIVETEDEFKELWLYDYPDPVKWYSFAVNRYAGQIYFFFDMELSFTILGEGLISRETSKDLEFLEWLQKEISDNISRIKSDTHGYNTFVSENLPFQKRYGRILRKDYWEIFPDNKKDFELNHLDDTIRILEKIVANSQGERSALEIKKLTARDFFRYCERGYDANGCFDKSNINLSPKEKYLQMADGRDCGLRNIDEESAIAFEQWYQNERHSVGHPWEIFRGGNSTHISLIVSKTETGWLLSLSGSSRARVIETLKMAVALNSANVPFYLHQANEILRMVTGQDYIGIVPETILPRYCHSHFPADNQIIDFMHIGTENKEEIIKKAYWYPEKDMKLKCNASL